MLKRIPQGVIFFEVLLFALSVGLLGYLGERNLWTYFWATVIISIVLFATLQIHKWKPVTEYLARREDTEFRIGKRFDEFGIANIFNMQIPEEQFERNQLTQELIRSGRVFSLLSLSAASYVDPSVKRHWDALRPKLDSGAPFRLLLQAPLCPEKKVRDALNSTATEFDSKLSLPRLLELYNRYPNLSIRFSPTSIYCAAFIVDDDMIYDPYHLGKLEDRIENYFVCFHLRAAKASQQGHSYYAILRAHFEHLWNTAEDFERYLVANQANLLGGEVYVKQLRLRHLPQALEA